MHGTQMDNSRNKKLSTRRTFSMPTLTEEIKPLVLVKGEVETGENLNFSYFLWKFRTVRILMQKTVISRKQKCLQVLCFWMKSFNKKKPICSGWKFKVWLSIAINIKNTYGKTGMSRKRSMDQNKKFLSWIVLRKREVYNGDLGLRSTCSYWQIWVWFSRKKNTNQFWFFWLSGLR